MGRTEVNVLLVAMAILPFLQNMLLNIGTGRYIHVCIYYIMYTYSFAKNFAITKFSIAISEQTLAVTSHYIPQIPRKGNPFHGPFAQLSYFLFFSLRIFRLAESSMIGNFVN